MTPSKKEQGPCGVPGCPLDGYFVDYVKGELTRLCKDVKRLNDRVWQIWVTMVTVLSAAVIGLLVAMLKG
ncbi:MAG: hypothetical protein ACYTAN_09770 [Planctomycetota bacterium]